MIKEYVINYETTIRDAVKYIDIESKKIICIVDETYKLLGIFTAGDMRNYILDKGDMSAKIGDIMNKNPIVYTNKEHAELEIHEKNLVAVPVIDSNGILKKIIFSNQNEKKSNVLSKVPVVIMAGGKGTRLYPYTKILPKALIPIGEYTISERIIKSFTEYGCNSVYFILKYKAQMIQAYFSEINKDYNVDYVKEDVFMGTGGGLKLLKKELKSTFIVSNCDVLINADFECAYKTHIDNQNKMTFICAMKDIQIPYGVIEVDENGDIENMVEKPSFSKLVNTGVYIIEPEVLELFSDEEFIHLPDIAIRCISSGGKVGVFPVSNKAWLDMGQFEEMKKMKEALGVNDMD